MKFGVRYEQSWATACDPKQKLTAKEKQTLSVRLTCGLNLIQKSGHVCLLNLRRRLLFRYRWYAKSDFKDSNEIGY
jgi:hypothetical protein